jgi:hypothetical protein
MQTTFRQFIPILAGIALCVLAMETGWAQDTAAPSVQQAGDPARWYHGDDYYQTLKKEAGAAYSESVAECKRSDGAGRAACMHAARKVYEQDMADAKTKSLDTAGR